MADDPGAHVSGLRAAFLADQQLLLHGYGGADAQAGNTPQAGPALGPVAQANPGVGWGGVGLPADVGSSKVLWFGRSRRPAARQRNASGSGAQAVYGTRGTGPGPRAGGSGGGDGRHGGAVGAPHHAGLLYVAAGPPPDDSLSVDEAVALAKRTPRGEPLPERLFRALRHLDSRSVALLLKDLSKAGADERAVELFDALRGLPERAPLRALCDVYTYTAAISLCIYQQAVERAMELLDEMGARRVERNVHTYTALMNVCIKSGKLSSALDVFERMRAARCQPNVVTFNTLIDVYGKLGQWERATSVIRMMRAEGVAPALRTYNTLIIASNMCNQPREALAVYQELLSENFAPNSTTYNALISAYGKLGQLDKVLEVYKDMVWKGLERSVITYSSLISACEKAGRWEAALQLFDEMVRDGCTPNTVTFNSLITACGQGCQWEKAQAVFAQMQASGCTPDVVTYTSLISAYERGGQWHLALAAFERMVAQGCRADAIVYNAIIDALWQTGVVSAQAKALELYTCAVDQGHFHAPRARACCTTRGAAAAPPGGGGRLGTGWGPGAPRWDLNLHALTAGVAILSLYLWLQDIRELVAARGERCLPPVLAVITDAGSSSKEQSNFVIKEAVSSTMAFWGAPFRPALDRAATGLLEAPGAAVGAWVGSAAFSAQMASLLPGAALGGGGGGAPDSRALLELERAAREQCHGAFGAVAGFEASHSLQLASMGAAYLGQRSGIISRVLDLGAALALKDEVIHDTVLLLDRTLSAASDQLPPALLPLAAAAALRLAITQDAAGGRGGGAPSAAAVAAAAGLDAGAVEAMQWQLAALLGGDTLAVSAMRCLKVYFERLGFRQMDRQGAYAVAGLPTMLAVEALFDMALLNCRPSAIAAALLYAERRARGAAPFWPSALARMTGYEDLSSPELALAVHSAQKLVRRALYSQIYRSQATALAADVAGARRAEPAPAPAPGPACAAPAALGGAPALSLALRSTSSGAGLAPAHGGGAESVWAAPGAPVGFGAAAAQLASPGGPPSSTALSGSLGFGALAQLAPVGAPPAGAAGAAPPPSQQQQQQPAPGGGAPPGADDPHLFESLALSLSLLGLGGGEPLSAESLGAALR